MIVYPDSISVNDKRNTYVPRSATLAVAGGPDACAHTVGGDSFDQSLSTECPATIRLKPSDSAEKFRKYGELPVDGAAGHHQLAERQRCDNRSPDHV